MMVWEFFIQHIPSRELIGVLVLPSLIYAASALYLSGWLKTRKRWPTGYSRKLFHFLIFLAAGLVQACLDYEGTIVFGSTVSLVIFYAIYKGDGHILFEAMAREKDRPRRAHYIIMPYLATLGGGVLSNFLFQPEIVVFGYLVTGFGDAIAEPVGTRFGRHRYRVPAFTRVKAYRSMEGSSAVLAGSYIALLTGAILSGWPVDAGLLLKFVLVALAATVVEALSPHGWDNFTIQVITCLVCYGLIF
jgi:phytol kinase